MWWLEVVGPDSFKSCLGENPGVSINRVCNSADGPLSFLLGIPQPAQRGPQLPLCLSPSDGIYFALDSLQWKVWKKEVGQSNLKPLKKKNFKMSITP